MKATKKLLKMLQKLRKLRRTLKVAALLLLISSCSSGRENSDYCLIFTPLFLRTEVINAMTLDEKKDFLQNNETYECICNNNCQKI